MNLALPAIVTCLALMLFAALSANVSRARRRFGVNAPAAAVSGHEGFERVARVQANTLEQLMLFLPGLWLFAFFVSPAWAAGLGVVWLLGRVYYAWSYYRDPASRAPGFIVGVAICVVLVSGALIGAVFTL
jgi:glutathione S-transferase